MEFTISGHINRALFITDSDDGTKAKVQDNASSGTRVRVTGSSEMENGTSAGVNLEYGVAGKYTADVTLDKPREFRTGTASQSIALRYAEVYYGGGFGKVSIGQGDQGGEGSVYPGQNAAVWIAHGQDKGGSTLGGYFGSLDGGAGRNERIRYDIPSMGPVSAALSVGNGDQISAGFGVSQDFAGTAFSAKLGTVQRPGKTGTVSASAGVKLASGIIVSGAWGKGKEHKGLLVPEVLGIAPWIDTGNMAGADSGLRWFGADGTSDESDVGATTTFDELMDSYQATIAAGKKKGATEQEMANAKNAEKWRMAAFNHKPYQCDRGGDAVDVGDPSVPGDCERRRSRHWQPEVQHMTDPSFYQAAVGYVFGNTKVGVSWYQSQDFMMKDSKGIALGIGVNHVLPKVNAEVYASAQNYKVTKMKGGNSVDDTVVMIGTRIKF